MRNLYARLGVDSDTSSRDLEVALAELHAANDSLADELAPIMLDTERERHYRRVHRQFMAAASLLDRLDDLPRDDNRWHRRLQEFRETD